MGRRGGEEGGREGRGGAPGRGRGWRCGRAGPLGARRQRGFRGCTPPPCARWRPRAPPRRTPRQARQGLGSARRRSRRESPASRERPRVTRPPPRRPRRVHRARSSPEGANLRGMLQERRGGAAALLLRHSPRKEGARLDAGELEGRAVRKVVGREEHCRVPLQDTHRRQPSAWQLIRPQRGPRTGRGGPEGGGPCPQGQARRGTTARGVEPTGSQVASTGSGANRVAGGEHGVDKRLVRAGGDHHLAPRDPVLLLQLRHQRFPQLRNPPARPVPRSHDPTTHPAAAPPRRTGRARACSRRSG